LERCRETVRKDAVRHWIEEAAALGITREELLHYISEEGEKSE
jgi:DNA-binding transcriptional regulator YhcF (GntR family)